MLSGQLAERYARALFEVAGEKKMVDEVEKVLVQIDATLTDNPFLTEVLYHPCMPPKAKKDTLKKIFVGSPEIVINFLMLVVDKKRETVLPAIINEYRELRQSKDGIVSVEAVSPYPLTDKQQALLVDKMAAGLRRKVELSTRIEPEMVGGLVIRVGDNLIDGSVKRQLEQLQKQLSA